MSDPFDRALRAAARRSRPAGVCPDAAVLASYADNGLSADERRLVETHAADCARCLEHLALLGAVSLDREAPEPSRSWLVRWGWLVPVATAVLVFAVWVRLPEQPASRDSGTSVATPMPPQVAEPVAAGPPERDEAGARPSVSAPLEPGNAVAEGRFAAKVSPAAPVPPAESAESKVDQAARIERPDADKKADIAPAPAASRPAPPDLQALTRQVGAEDARARAVGRTAAPAATPAPVTNPQMADAAKDAEQPRSLKEEVRVTGAPQREAQLLKSTSAQASSQVSASPSEAYRFDAHRIERSADGGRTWQVALLDAGVTFTTAGCDSGGPCWFGTADGQVLRRTAAGFSRTALPVRLTVTSIAPAGAGTAVVTVEGGQRFHTVDGGVTWVPIP